MRDQLPESALTLLSTQYVYWAFIWVGYNIGIILYSQGLTQISRYLAQEVDFFATQP